VPKVLRERVFRCFFWSNERNEPPHVHAESGDGYAKMWLRSPVVVAESPGFSPRELRDVLEIVTRRRAMMEKAWHDHFEA
jgi:Domain of unknown function (DUF4160)